MKKLLLSTFTAAACLAAAHDSLEAQLIRVEPGYVRAPFVRVYRTPDGGRRVRAPFTDVYSPGYAYPVQQQYERGHAGPYAPPQVPGQVQPSGDLLTAQERARHQLAAAADRLHRDLGRMVGGSQWQEYLRLPDSVFAGLHPNQPTPLELNIDLDQLEQVLARFTQIANDEQYNMISELASFQAVHQNLVEFLDASHPPPPPPSPPAGPQESEEIPLFHPGQGPDQSSRP
ncbi:MAG: hypothetical protein GTO53_01865 [Planctomycetales bacterium]|nr:hypothetical protein [Planctomycetales bacterium]NIM07918.1 hypothetical protein [Planctomycetales bacterium]NIN07405.1 hypothetical protein [Planctomycetales bacterium]NIN76509.1 hypothetical protein [Planctomycetales bacterium]NIO33699.1 hypothetical protein [Planctomycetales bacterium]